MNDNNFVYYCSQEDLVNAADVYLARRQLAKHRPTYVHFTIDLGSHCAAVQITIFPIKIPQFPIQRIFRPQYQYWVCHAAILTNHTHLKISRVVESLIGAYFRLGEWEISDGDWYALLNHSDIYTYKIHLSEARNHDPSLFLPGEPCSVIANGILPKYPDSTAVCSSGPKSTTLGETINEGITCLDTAVSNDSLHRCITPERNGRPRDSIAQERLRKDKTDEDLVAWIHTLIKKGLAAQTDLFQEPELEQEPKLLKSYESHALELFQLASQTKKHSRVSIWWLRFLAGCILFASPSLPARPFSENIAISTAFANATLDRWKSIAGFLCSLVCRLYQYWKDEAFVIFTAAAGTTTLFSNAQVPYRLILLKGVLLQKYHLSDKIAC